MRSETSNMSVLFNTWSKVAEHYRKLLSQRKGYDLRTIPCAGIVCALISVIFWSAAGLGVKLADDVHAIEVLTFSAVIQSTIYFCIILYQKQRMLGQPEERIHLFLRCTLGTVSMACLYTSYRLIPLSDATTIRFTAPIFVSVFAFILLGEPFGVFDMVSAAITIGGVILVGRPSFLFCTEPEEMTSDTIVGLVLALCSAVFIAISMTVMRKLQKTGSAVVIFWFSMSSVLLGAIALWIMDEWKWPSNATVWLIIVMTGLSLSLDLLFITLALKLDNAGPVSVVQALNVVFSFIFSFTILNEKFRVTSVIGGAFILVSICLTSGHKMYSDYKKTQTETIKECYDPESKSVYVVNGVDPYDPKILSFNQRKASKISILFKI